MTFEQAMHEAGWEPRRMQLGLVVEDEVEWEWPCNRYRISDAKARGLYHEHGITPTPF